MTVSLSLNNTGISLRVSPQIIYFYPTKVTAYVNLFINDATSWTIGKTNNLVLTPGGTTYASSVSIPLVAVATGSGIPTITLTTGTLNKKSASFSITCSE